MEKVKRLALLVGCNYAHTKNELHGCINDVLAIRKVLIGHFGFHPDDVELLTDAAHASSSSVMPTGANIKMALCGMVDKAKPGDVLYFHYSGHGTLTPPVKPGHKQEEAIVPCDFNLITDVDFRALVNGLPKGASFTMLSDSCHSGGLIDKEKEQIGPSSSSSVKETRNKAKPKVIPYQSVLEQLSTLTGINISDNDVATHMLQSFGDDASLKFRRLSQPHEHDDVKFRRLNPDDGILLSGCQWDETSADMNPNEGGGC